MHHSSLISLTRMPALSSAHIKAKTHQTFSIDFQALFRNFENSWLKLKIIKLQLILFWCPLHWGSHRFSTKFTSFSSGPIHKENTKACNCIKSAKNLDDKKKMVTSDSRLQFWGCYLKDPITLPAISLILNRKNGSEICLFLDLFF